MNPSDAAPPPVGTRVHVRLVTNHHVSYWRMRRRPDWTGKLVYVLPAGAQPPAEYCGEPGPNKPFAVHARTSQYSRWVIDVSKEPNWSYLKSVVMGPAMYWEAL